MVPDYRDNAIDLTGGLDVDIPRFSSGIERNIEMIVG